MQDPVSSWKLITNSNSISNNKQPMVCDAELAGQLYKQGDL